MTPRKKFDISLVPERPDLSFEIVLWGDGRQYIAGVDEAGRGAIAGPVAAGAVVLPSENLNIYDQLNGVRDSKEMTAKTREKWALEIKAAATSWAVGFASCEEIDEIGIVPATRLAASRALGELSCPVDHILIDYLTLPDVDLPQTALVKGDARSLSIASASILAKTARDALMFEMDGEFSGYHFRSNKGYGTKAHFKAIDALGPCRQHRRSFSPVREYYSLFPPNKKTDLVCISGAP